MGFFGRSTSATRTRKLTATSRFLPRIEHLESRITPWNTSGNLWPASSLVTLSFVPDGTDLGGVSSNLFATLNARFGSASVWQPQIMKAAQVWAKNTDLNFAVVSDNGAPIGSGAYQQGDPGFGDIRIGGYNFGSSSLAMAYSPPPINNFSLAGDIHFNTGQAWNIGSTYDLFTVAAHEFGHALGMAHSGVIYASEYATYTNVKTGIDWDDIYGIRAAYSSNLPRTGDWNDVWGGGNNSFTTATDVTQHTQGDLTVLRTDRDITTTSDVDFFKVTVPSGVLSTVQISAQSGGLSLLAPKITVYASDQSTILGSANGLNQYGATQTVTLNGQLSAGQVIYIKVQGADSTPFGTGKYALGMRFGSAALPTQLPPVTQLANGTPLSGGGGIASAASQELRIDPPAGWAFETSSETRQSIAVDARGNYVVTWSGFRATTGAWEIFAQLFDANHVPDSDPFLVSSGTGQNKYPAVAMSYGGNFVITWATLGTDGSGWNILARAYDTETGAWTNAFQVNQIAGNTQTYPTAAIDKVGNMVITWSSQHQDGSGWGIYARRFDVTGAALGDEFRVNTRVTADQQHSSIAMDALGNFAVVWSSNNQDGSAWGVIGRRFDSAGTALGGEFVVNTYNAGDQRHASIAMDREGHYVVVWASNGQDGNGWGVFGQVFAADGTKVRSEFRVNTTTVGDQTKPAVSMSWQGDFLITWVSSGGGGAPKPAWIPGGILPLNVESTTSELVGSLLGGGSASWNVYAQQFDFMHPEGPEFRVNMETGGEQQGASIAMNGMGRIVVGWTVTSADGSMLKVQPFTSGAGELHAHEESEVRLNAFLGTSPSAFTPPAGVHREDTSQLRRALSTSIATSSAQNTKAVVFEGKSTRGSTSHAAFADLAGGTSSDAPMFEGRATDEEIKPCAPNSIEGAHDVNPNTTIDAGMNVSESDESRLGGDESTIESTENLAGGAAPTGPAAIALASLVAPFGHWRPNKRQDLRGGRRRKSR